MYSSLAISRPWTASLDLPVRVGLFRAFRCYFAVHVFLQTLEMYWTPLDRALIFSVQGILLAATLLVWHRALYPLGIALLLVFKLFLIREGFPMTGNHLYVEALVLFVLMAFSTDRQSTTAGAGGVPLVQGTGVRLVQLTVLTIYMYSGLHKLLDGFWLRGEYLGQSLYAEGSVGFWYTMQLILRGVAAVFGLELGELPYPQSAGLGAAPVTVPGWTIPVLLVVSWLTILSEIVVPWLVALPRTRRLGVHLMLWLAVAVGLMSWELDFMFVAVGSILLFFPRSFLRNYWLLGSIHVLWSLWVFFADVRIGVL